ncbi:PREDICTED: ankyrin repeat and LEM domain-containing protein 2 isoform X2 [Nanorana parkeri]|uniref:ankyrin repeat and LEM domain-containing protein 2 isoform X1 n=1 Tax=Nanorana parkeri TaxID=125878 RepID=UPI00085445E5|nr:PREDICTED: ankyrin repeat and LEM domain-containing protein 2 isoform X1 [Nanorana parkeri]XP_018413128.1 PREDICTED: ankyrin repeat and LEM domain-containing protein 2 isoform X2 [Nanorana parkeri]
MEEILTNLKLLDPDELREEIQKAGLHCGPITSTTRSTFERKLARTLLEQQGVNLEALNSNVGTPAADYTQNTQRFQATHCSEDREFGYNVGLNPPVEEASSLHHNVASLNLLDRACVANQIHSNAPPVFYAVCPLYEDTLTKNEKIHIYMDKKEALQVVKMLKGSRFKAFHSRDDAEKFANGICDYYSSPSKSLLPLSPVKISSPLLRDAYSTAETDCLSKEKANSFKSPRTQDLTAKLRKAVEKGDSSTFAELIWSNPRYLIGSGDNPTVVQEGCRYNVMHVAARENQAGISQLLLNTLENPEFMRLMYPDDDDSMLQKRIQYIVDLYLNTPDKMAFDTPLHFACKFGNVEVVNMLCSHPDIIKNPRNKYNQIPEEVICERSKNKSMELKIKIRECLKGHFYVPLLRAEDNSSFPIIGVPWSPEQPDFSQSKYSVSPKDPLLAVRAFAGPMSPSKAEDFRRIWKTPPRERAGFFHNVRKTDPERGEERVGRELAHELDVPWVEYWEFLGCFADLSSQEGLGRLEEYLSKKEVNERLQMDHDYEICNRYRTPSPAGRSKKFCNSVSVGAFLEDDDEDMSLEEIKNRQNAALKNSSSVESITAPECIMDTTPIPSSPRKEGSKHGYCSPLSSDCRHQQDFEHRILSPVSNLLSEFEKLSLSELNEDGEGSSHTDLAVHRQSRINAHIESSSSLTRTESSSVLQAGEALSNISLTGKLSLGNSNELPFSNFCSEFPAPQVIMKTPSKHQCAKATFLLGKEPSKLDSDVLAAVEKVDIDAQKYPSISRWIKDVRSYSSTERQSWPSPAVLLGKNKSQICSSNSPSGLGFSTPGRSSPIPGSPGKYVNSSDYSSPGRYSPAYASHIQLLRIRNFSDHSSL